MQDSQPSDPLKVAWRGANGSTPVATGARFAGACAGLATTWLLAVLIPSRPDPGLPPGFAAASRLDIRREMLLFVTAIALTLAGGFVGAWWASRRTSSASTIVAERSRQRGGSTTLPVAVSAIAAHGLVVWTFLLAAFPRLHVRGLVVLGAAMLASAGAALLLGGGSIQRGAYFLGAASPVILLAFVGKRPIPFAGLATAGAYVLPAVAGALWGRVSEPPRLLRRMTVGVLLPASFTVLAAVAILGAPRVGDVFEDGHSLLPASEYLRGELPYRDIVPGHGLLSDGLFQAASLRLFGDDYRGFARGQKLFGAFFWPSLYAVGFAATGSAAVGFATVSLSFLAFPQYAFPRVLVSLLVVAIATGAARTGKPWAWRTCGFALPLAFFFSVDFATYAAAAVVTASIVARGDRRANARAWALGAFIGAATGLTPLALFGILPDFLRGTALFVPRLFPVYAQGFPPFGATPAQLEVNALPGYLAYGFVALALLLLGAQLPRGGSVSNGARSVLPLLAWIVAAMLSVAERHHFGYVFFGVPAAIVLLARWFAGSGRDAPARTGRPVRAALAGAAIAAFAIPHGPLRLIGAVEGGIRDPRWPPETRALAQPRRALGGLFRANDRVLILQTGELMRRAGFADGDTWIDFVNAPGLYFLFDRPCPIRYYEVPFYESESAQTEVIDAIERNPHVRAALVSAGNGEIDAVPNAVRAPRVYAYLRTHFRPFLREGAVEYWIREAPSRP